jgi:DNA-binding CsgD family transcriptional regulator
MVSMREAAEIIGISEETVRTRAHYGRAIDAPLGLARQRRNQDTKRVHPKLPFEQDEACQEIVRDNPNGMRLEQVGKALGCTRERVRQVERKALAKLKRLGVTRRELEQMRSYAIDLDGIRDARVAMGNRRVGLGRR